LPEIVLVAVLPPIQMPVMELPGAKRSTQEPLLEKLDLPSIEVEDPTQRAFSV